MNIRCNNGGLRCGEAITRVQQRRPKGARQTCREEKKLSANVHAQETPKQRLVRTMIGKLAPVFASFFFFLLGGQCATVGGSEPEHLSG